MGIGHSPARTRFVGGSALAVVVATLLGCSPDEEDERSESVASGEVGPYDVQVGDCLAEFPKATQATTLEKAPCSEPHTDEIFASGTIPDGEYPGAQAVETAAHEICIAQFDEFVGIPYDDSVLDVGFLAPTEQSWQEGDREVLCTVFDPLEEVTGSLRGAER